MHTILPSRASRQVPLNATIGDRTLDDASWRYYGNRCVSSSTITSLPGYSIQHGGRSRYMPLPSRAAASRAPLLRTPAYALLMLLLLVGTGCANRIRREVV